ncbi:MAG: glycosyltransferase [Prochlorothrix sp.]|nr:glycosyltransferase [Prochlorothrix sp.]
MTVPLPRVSLCMIVKDEEAQIERCLDSVMGWVDEAIVVDTGSQDRTVALAQAKGAQVHHYPWPGDFSTARNWALNQVTGDWVLVLDADETFLVEQVQALQQLLTQENILVITLLRQEVGAIQSPYSRISRLFRRHPQVYFSRPYHAMVDDSVLALQAQEPHWRVIAFPDVALQHWGYEPGTIAARAKAERAQIALESHLQEHPGDPYTCAKLGALYGSLGHWSRGQTLLHTGLTQLAQTEQAAEIAYELHYHLGIAASHLGDPDTAVAHYEAALNQEVDDRLKLGACNNLGSLLLNQNQTELAQLVFEQALEWDPDFALGHYNLGLTKRALGDGAGAIAAYQRALKLNPSHASTCQNLGVLLLKRGQIQIGAGLLARAIDLHRAQNNPDEADRLAQTLQELGFASPSPIGPETRPLPTDHP